MGRRMQRTAVAGMFSIAAAVGAAADAPAPSNAAADAQPVGKALYARHCLSCHQADGRGVPNMQPPIKGGTWVKGDAKALAMFVMTGGFDSANRKEGAASENPMPPFRQLSDEDLAAILTYIRQKYGDGASAVEPALVTEARATLPPQ